MPIREVGASVEEKERRSSQLICAHGCTLLALLQRALTGIAIKDSGDSCDEHTCDAAGGVSWRNDDKEPRN